MLGLYLLSAASALFLPAFVAAGEWDAVTRRAPAPPGPGWVAAAELAPRSFLLSALALSLVTARGWLRRGRPGLALASGVGGVASGGVLALVCLGFAPPDAAEAEKVAER